MKQSEINELNQSRESLSAIYLPLRSRLYTSPLNRLEEKAKLLDEWANGQTYNPQFKYAPPPDGWTKPLQTFLAKYKPQNLWGQFLYEDARYTLSKLQAIETRDYARMTELTTDIYGIVDDTLLEAAYNLLNDTATDERIEENIPASEAADFLRRALAQIELHEWKVVVDDRMSATMSVRSVEKRINVQSEALFSQQKLQRLLVHEIGTHVFRHMNGTQNPLQLLRMGLLDYQITEEGLATYHEKKYDLSHSKIQRIYASRVIAARLCREQSFFDVFSQIVPYTDPDAAFAIVTRAKRGMENTSQPGVHVKDKVYFEGFRVISSHLEANPEDYTLLMCGKVSLKMLPALKDLRKHGLIVEPTYLPELLTKQMFT